MESGLIKVASISHGSLFTFTDECSMTIAMFLNREERDGGAMTRIADLQCFIPDDRVEIFRQALLDALSPDSQRRRKRDCADEDTAELGW